MTDLELLQLAAKAAGVQYELDKDGIMWTRDPWFPLTDDGDALRLAVKLGFAVSVEFQVGSTAVLWGPPTGVIREQHGDDPCAATRRAIVRAAAEVGRTRRME